jgi:hypothetical protein
MSVINHRVGSVQTARKVTRGMQVQDTGSKVDPLTLVAGGSLIGLGMLKE